MCVPCNGITLPPYAFGADSAPSATMSSVASSGNRCTYRVGSRLRDREGLQEFPELASNFTKANELRLPGVCARDCPQQHPRRDDPTAPLFCAVTLRPSKPTGKRAVDSDGNRIAPTAVDALAALSADEAAERLVLDWSAPIRHDTFYKAVFRPAVLRTNRLGGDGQVLPRALKFHALRHTYASLCVAAGIPPLHLSRFMGHAKVTTTLAIYTHLFDGDHHAETMVALEAMSRPVDAPNVVPMRRRR